MEKFDDLVGKTRLDIIVFEQRIKALENFKQKHKKKKHCYRCFDDFYCCDICEQHDCDSTTLRYCGICQQDYCNKCLDDQNGYSCCAWYCNNCYSAGAKECLKCCGDVFEN